MKYETRAEALREQLNASQIIERLKLPEAFGIEHVLGLRDKEDFDSKWMEAFEKVESLKSVISLPAESADSVKALRESSYLHAFAKWKSPDLAACVSDDLGLIGDAIAMNLDDTWITYLLHCYLDGIIPTS